jgi:hypothetical protein
MSLKTTGYQVICMHPKKRVLAVFETMTEANQIAAALTNAKGVTYAVEEVKVCKTHFSDFRTSFLSFGLV